MGCPCLVPFEFIQTRHSDNFRLRFKCTVRNWAIFDHLTNSVAIRASYGRIGLENTIAPHFARTAVFSISVEMSSFVRLVICDRSFLQNIFVSSQMKPEWPGQRRSLPTRWSAWRRRREPYKATHTCVRRKARVASCPTARFNSPACRRDVPDRIASRSRRAAVDPFAGGGAGKRTRSHTGHCLPSDATRLFASAERVLARVGAALEDVVYWTVYDSR